MLDFGCSVLADELRSDIAGTLPFMAPEIFRAPSVLYEPAPVDIWACGVILVELLFGVHHFSHMMSWTPATPITPDRFLDLSSFFRDGFVISPALEQKYGHVELCLASLLERLLTLDQAHRCSARHALESDWLMVQRPPP